MSWNIQKPGDYINGPLTVAGTATISGVMTLTGGSSTVGALSFPIGTIKAVGMTATTAHLAGNVSTLKFGINDGGADFGGLHVFNIHNGTFSSCEVGIFTGEGGISVPTQRMRIDKVGNVGIGAAPSAWNSDYRAIDVGVNGCIAGRVGGSNTLDIISNGFRNAAGNYVYKSAVSTPAARYLLDGSTGSHIWFSGVAGTAGNTIAGFTTAAMTLTTAGNLAFPTGKGIDFSAVTGGTGTATANVLNDYEEGTWVPVPTAGTGSFTSVTGAAGTYTKIGRMVTATAFFKILVNGGGGSFIQVAGLPFTLGSMNNIGVGRVDATTGEMFQIKLNAFTAVGNIWTYNNSYPGADGAEFPMTLVYFV